MAKGSDNYGGRYTQKNFRINRNKLHFYGAGITTVRALLDKLQ